MAKLFEIDHFGYIDAFVVKRMAEDVYILVKVLNLYIPRA